MLAKAQLTSRLENQGKSRLEDSSVSSDKKNLEKEFSMEPLDADDSFMNPPTVHMKIGKNLVKNYEKRRTKDAQPIDSSPKEIFVTTSLNNQIFFTAVGEQARRKHDESTLGIKPCGLHPYCSNMFRGGEDIALVMINSPEFHDKFEKKTWVCYYHAKASMEGQEIQTQTKVDENTQATPKNTKLGTEAETAAVGAPKRKNKDVDKNNPATLNPNLADTFEKCKPSAVLEPEQL